MIYLVRKYIQRAKRSTFLPLFFYSLLCCCSQGSYADCRTRGRVTNSDLQLKLTSTSCTFDFGSREQEAYRAVLDLKIPKARLILAELKKTKSDNLILLYLDNLTEAVSVFVSENPADYKTYLDHFDDRISILDECNEKSPWKKFLIAEMKFQQGTLKAKFKEEIDGFYMMRQSYKLLEENQKEFPDFLPNYKTLGTLKIMLGSIPDKYTWLTDLAGLKGDTELGLKYLDKSEKSDPVFGEEASVINIVCRNYIVNTDDKRLPQMEQIISKHPESLLYRYLHATILIRNTQGAKALETINAVPHSEEYLDFPYIHFIKGELLLFKGRYGEARKEYELFLKQFKGKNSIKDTWLKVALCYSIENKERETKTALDQILKNGQEVYDSDKYAQKVALTGEIPDKVLSKIRFYTDGGYYKEATALLKTISSSTYHRKRDKLEYFYRTGRLYHKMGNIPDAITYYEKTIQINGEDTYYFAPNAALQLGYIYQAEKNNAKAKEYFEKALKYKNHEYKNSIDNKAKSALNSL